MKKLGIFDIDFTITRKETLIQFFIYMIKKDYKNIRFIPRALFSAILYGIRVYDEKKVKESFLKFIENKKEDELKEIASGFYEEVLSKILYKDALEKIKELKKLGYEIYLISASPEFYLNEFYKIKEVSQIIGTRYVFEDGIFIRKMLGENCKGDEKVIRLKKHLKENNIEVDFENSLMFSDSLSDKPLLDLVGKGYLINYKKRADYEILNWK